MKTEFTFPHRDGTVTAIPQAVTYNGQSGHFWEFYGENGLTGRYVRLAKTFMKDRSTRKDIIEQFEKIACGLE